MFEFRKIEEIKPNTEILDVIKSCVYTIKTDSTTTYLEYDRKKCINILISY